MTEGNNNKQKTIGKIVYTNFSIGENPLSGWEALPISNDKYKVTRKNKSETELSIGDETQAGVVSLDKNGNLSVGKWTVPVGKDIIPGWEARAKRGKESFFVRREDGTSFNVKIGEYIEGHGKSELDEFGNIRAGNISILVHKKQYELNLLVLNSPEKGGYTSYFNLIEPNNDKNRKDGAKGVFFRTKEIKRPSSFSEYGPDGQLYSTAIFWSSSSDKFVQGKIRPLAVAIKERAIYEQIKGMENLASEISVEPETIQGYSDFKKELSEINNKSWTEYSFLVNQGIDLFKGKDLSPAKGKRESALTS